MGSTRVSLHDRWIDVPEGALNTWLRLLVSEIEAEPVHAPWLDEARDDWLEAATAGFGFELPPELDAFVIDDGRRRRLLSLCERARARLAGLGDPIAPDLLNRINEGNRSGTFVRPVDAAVFRTTAEQFVDLLRRTTL